MDTITITLRSMNFYQAREHWALKGIDVDGPAAQVVLRVSAADGQARDVVIDVPPIELKLTLEAARASGVPGNANQIAMAEALVSLESHLQDVTRLADLPSVWVVQPSQPEPVPPPEDVMQRAAKLMRWEAVTLGGTHAAAR